jgi:hypothetical protein
MDQLSPLIFGPVKRILAIAFIFLLSAQCIFKLGIITYFQANRKYIAEVLCINKKNPMTLCNGQCFLDRNLALADEETPQQVPVNTKLKIETSIFIGSNFDLVLALTSLDIEKNCSPQPLYRPYTASSLFHPPC